MSYYRTLPDPSLNGRWLVVHTIAGTAGAVSVDADCPSQSAAEHEAAWLEAERTLCAGSGGRWATDQGQTQQRPA